VIANARSTGGSGGTWGLLDQTERDDLYDLIEWIADQPWCDGNVGMVGTSYFAMAQIAAAVAGPPSLKAIFPLGNNESVYDVAWHHGLCASSFLSPWIASVGGLGVKDDKVWRGKVLGFVTRAASGAVAVARNDSQLRLSRLSVGWPRDFMITGPASLRLELHRLSRAPPDTDDAMIAGEVQGDATG
jgi:predicted acyl esterase